MVSLHQAMGLPVLLWNPFMHPIRIHLGFGALVRMPSLLRATAAIMAQQTGAGVTAVALNRDGPWTYGLLGFQSWSVGGNPTFGTQNNLFGEPFIAYTTKSAFTFVSNMQAQYNYDSRRTSNPLYVGVSKVEVIDGVPISLAAGPIYYLSNTPGGPSGWGGRATVTLVIAK